jgi:urease accessory protein
MAQGTDPTRLGRAASAHRGLHGQLDVQAEVVAGRTRLTSVRQQPPLQIMRAWHLDEALPDLATVTIASPSGGVLQGDELDIRFDLKPGARLRVGTQSATRIYRCPDASARIRTELTVLAEGHLEYLPDPFVPYAGSRLASSTIARVAPDATLILGEVVTGGRLARGEAFDAASFDSRIELRRLDGELLARDVLRMSADEPPSRLGRLDKALAVGTLFVVSRGFDPGALRSAPVIERSGRAFVGASELPAGAGAWLRVLAEDGRTATAIVAAGSSAARLAILGSRPPGDRRP